MSIGPILIALRTEKHIYQKELAAYLNVSIGTISNYEKELHYPDLETLGKIADFYDVSTDYLLGRTECRYSLDKLVTPLVDTYNYNDLLDTVLQLPQPSRQSLKDYLEYLLFKVKPLPNSNGKKK
ncbi:MAG: helix-turn-helix transcriptional regulator [Lachnospiraceae bacterium]|nr:helix-turn-helix transcriptional regulator [Lachnospiraceae bacterium]